MVAFVLRSERSAGGLPIDVLSVLPCASQSSPALVTPLPDELLFPFLLPCLSTLGNVGRHAHGCVVLLVSGMFSSQCRRWVTLCASREMLSTAVSERRLQELRSASSSCLSSVHHAETGNHRPGPMCGGGCCCRMSPFCQRQATKFT